MSKKKFKIGDKVNYHTIVDGKPVVTKGHEITCVYNGGKFVNLSGITGKVDVAKIDRQEKEKKTLKDLGKKKKPVKAKDTKKKPAKKEKKKIVRTEIIKGKYLFTATEKAQMSNELAQTQIDKGLVEDEKKSIMAGYKDRLDRFDWDINRLSRNVVNGYEIRDFDCIIEKNFDKHTKRFIDKHTKKVIDERPLDPSDYQEELDI